MTNPFKVVGFSTNTAAARESRRWQLFDRDLVQQDILNHFNTRIGQRLGRPSFGCRIWEYFMQQRTPDVVDQIREEIERVCRFDPRVIFEGSDLFETDHGIIAKIRLRMNIEEGMWTFNVDFDERQQTAMRG